MIDRQRLHTDISRARDDVRVRVRDFLIAGNLYDEAEGVDLLSLPEETVATLYRIVHGHIRHPERHNHDHTLMSAYRERVRRTLAPRDVRDYMYLSKHPGRFGPSNGLKRRVRECRDNEWHVAFPFYVRPARHHGTDVGLGLFALVPFVKGQLLGQFTGRIHHSRNKRETGQWYKKNAGRENYAIQITHGAHTYIVNPLDPGDRFVIANNYAAYINEPSLPPWKVNDPVQIRESRRNGIARKYDFEDGSYTVEFADGAHVEYLADELHSHPARETHNRRRSYRANCFWVDFPVPLNDLYAFSTRRAGIEDQYVFRRRQSVHDCRVTYSLEDVVKTFDVYSDTSVFFNVTPVRAKRLQKGNVVVLKQNVFPGLDRVGEIIDVQKEGIVVYHTVADHTRWRLPTRVLAGKVENGKCSACKNRDDPTCLACTVVAFPCIHACSDIGANDELLCYYSPETVRTRGLRCEETLDHDELGPSWAAPETM